MVVERFTKNIADINKKLIISSMGRCHVQHSFTLFKEQYPKYQIDKFLSMWTHLAPLKVNSTNQRFRDIVVARDYEDHIHGLYTYLGTPNDTLIIRHIIIPGPIGRQTILKQFIEHIITLGMEKNCTMIKIHGLNNKDWRSLFLQEAGAKRITPTCLQINLSC